MLHRVIRSVRNCPTARAGRARRAVRRSRGGLADASDRVPRRELVDLSMRTEVDPTEAAAAAEVLPRCCGEA